MKSTCFTACAVRSNRSTPAHQCNSWTISGRFNGCLRKYSLIATEATHQPSDERVVSECCCVIFIDNNITLTGTATGLRPTNSRDYFAAGGGLSPVVSTFSMVVLVALSGLVSTFCSTVAVVVPLGVVTEVSDFLSVVFVCSQPTVAKPAMQAIVK